jgi:hypothetical protein
VDVHLLVLDHRRLLGRGEPGVGFGGRRRVHTAAVSTAVTAGSAGSVALSASGTPAGVSVSFSPASVTAGGGSTMTVSTTASVAGGSYPITVTGAGSSAAHSATYILTVTSPGGGPVLLSQGKPATASSLESASYPAASAFDGNLTSTRWASKEGVDPQWLRVDLGASVSSDGTTWTTIYSTTTGNGGADDLTGLTGTGRYVRVYGTARGTSYGYSLYEMQVYGTAG